VNYVIVHLIIFKICVVFVVQNDEVLCPGEHVLPRK